ncbi:MAG TPA: phosphoenolpyruvate carboxykinase (GTP), partial [Chromatiales bacterium]|nr:phosphoenolpyruvate carboxykinase (GTP) [Chromatiales bacterium]
MSTSNQALQQWIDEVTALTRPDQVKWCDGSEAEYQSLIEQMLASGDL